MMPVAQRHRNVLSGEGVCGRLYTPAQPSAWKEDSQDLSHQSDGEETVDHRVDLFGHAELAEVPLAHGLAVQDLGEHLVETRHVRARLQFVGGHVETRHRRRSTRLGGVVVARPSKAGTTTCWGADDLLCGIRCLSS